MLATLICLPSCALFLLLHTSLALAVRDHPDVQEEGYQATQHWLLCPPSCSCDPLPQHKAILDCRERGLSNVPLPLPNNTLKLYLDNNALQVLDTLGPVPDLEVITLTRNALSDIMPDVFRHTPRLRFLDLSVNNLRDTLPDNSFSKLSYMVFLNLSGNFLNHVSNARFQELGSLRTLDLSRNAISQIDRDAFQSLQNLQTLDLSNNRLSHLQQEWFHQLGNLQKLTLYQNKIGRLSNTVFWSLSSLKFLDLSHNVISRVGRLSFKGMTETIKIDLSYNNITNLQEGTIKTMDALNEADFSHNPLVFFDGAFKLSPKLTILRLDYTEQLRDLTEHSLEGLTGLRRLYVSHSTLSKIHPRAFAELVNLQELHLSQTQLQTLSKETFEPFQSIESVYLRDNPWHCDCLLHWLLRWLGDQKKGHMVSPHDTQCLTPSALAGSPILDALDHHMSCRNATAIPINQTTDFLLGSDAVLSCNIQGHPKPTLTWLTPRNIMLHWVNTTITDHASVHGPQGNNFEERELKRFELLSNGSLKVKHVGRGDSGKYRCIASNALSNSTGVVILALNSHFMQEIKLMSILVGLVTSVAFLLLTFLGQFVSWVMDRCGWECPCSCCGRFGSRKGQQLWRMLENMETYKSQQLDRLRDNYANQAQRIKDNCMQQMEWLRESYSCQVERLRDIRDYGTHQIDKIRDNYYSQVQKVRDYSTSQIDRLRENYLFQRTRIRKFSAHQLFKLRENYKLQQQHLNKILESLNLDSCKANCSRTDSIIFETSDLALQSVFRNSALHLEYVETGSQISAYYTPDDSASEVSSTKSEKSHLNFDVGIIPVTRYKKKKCFKSLAASRKDVGCSTTDLNLQLDLPICTSIVPLELIDVPEDHSSPNDLNQPVPLTPPLPNQIPMPENNAKATLLEENNSTLLEENDSLLPDKHETTLLKEIPECTAENLTEEYSNSSHLTPTDLHLASIIPLQDNVNETIV